MEQHAINTNFAYTTKPVTIEALQWTDDMPMAEMIDFTDDLVRLDDTTEDFRVYDRISNAWVSFQYGDWIIKGTEGEFYPCPDDEFREKFEKARKVLPY